MTPKHLAAAAALVAIPLALISVSLSAATSDDAALSETEIRARGIATRAAAAARCFGVIEWASSHATSCVRA